MIVRSATNLEWSSALRVLFEHLPQEERAIRVANTLALLRNSDLDKRSVLGAWIGDTLVGAHLIAPLKGDCAMAWPAQVKSGINPAIADTLMRAGLAQAQARGATFVQVILSAQDAGITGSLLRASYREVTELVYMVHPLGAIQTPAQSQSQKPLTPGPSPLSTGERGAYRQALRYETSDVADPALFQQTLMETYEGTLDCPELNNIRSVEQILEAHRGQGRFDSQLWWLVWHNDRPVGILLVNAVADTGDWDVSYMGVVPAARRCGVGRDMLSAALKAAQFADIAQMTLVVDARNLAAIGLYSSTGFVETERRRLWLYFFNRPSDMKGG